MGLETGPGDAAVSVGSVGGDRGWADGDEFVFQRDVAIDFAFVAGELGSKDAVGWGVDGDAPMGKYGRLYDPYSAIRHPSHRWRPDNPVIPANSKPLVFPP